MLKGDTWVPCLWNPFFSPPPLSQQSINLSWYTSRSAGHISLAAERFCLERNRKMRGRDKDWAMGCRAGWGYSQAMRTWALRLLVVPAELQATHWHQKSSGPNNSSTCCRVISMLASLTTRPARTDRGHEEKKRGERGGKWRKGNGGRKH